MFEFEAKCIRDFLLCVEGQDTSSLLAKAEEAMSGYLVLNGTGPEPVFVGIPPRWEENPCGIGGYTWTMSRLLYMVTLCKAFLITGQRRYLDKVETDLWDWFTTVPMPPVPTDYDSACYYHCVHNWRMLEVGHRMIYTFPILAGVLRVYGRDRSLIARMEQSFAEHAERISAGSPLLWPDEDHNHYTQEINGLLSAAAMLPQDPRSEKWKTQAITALEHCCENQLTEDGAQIEGASLYHSAVVVDFCYSLHFAQMCGASFSRAFTDRLRNSMDFSVHVMAPNGETFPYGDGDQKLKNGIDAAILSFLVFGEQKHLATLRRFVPVTEICKQLYLEFPWGFPGIDRLLAWLDVPLQENVRLLPVTTVQRQMDQYITRTDWGKDAVCLYFSCNSPINLRSNHAHMDQLGVIFGAYGKMLLQDPGRFTYKDCEDRHLFKSSRVHNLPTVDGRDGFEYKATFGYGPMNDGAITAVMDEPGIQGAYGYHNNYAPVRVSRTAALIDNEILLLADTYEHVKDQNMAVYFHLNSTSAAVECTDIITRDTDVNVAISCAEGIVPQLMPGRISDEFYHDYPSTRAVYSRIAENDRETLVFVVVPGKGDVQPVKDFAFRDSGIHFVHRGKEYNITLNNGIFTM